MNHPRYPAVAFLGLLFLPVLAHAQVTVTSTTYTSGQNVTVNDPTSIATSGTVEVNSGATVTFKSAGSITLSPGFRAYDGSLFIARLTVDTDGDGIPDAWEIARGLNPANAADAAYTTSLGLTNLLEYLLGTIPGAAKQADGGNSNALKVHRPNNP